MNKRNLTLFILLLLPIFAFASSFYLGFSGEGTYNFVSANTGYRDNTSYKPVTGIGLSIPAIYKVNSWFGVESGFKYVQKNYRWEHKVNQQSSGAYTDYLEYTNHYLELPLLANFYLGNETIRNVSAIGGYVGFLAGADWKGRLARWDVPSYAEVEDLQQTVSGKRTLTSTDNRFEAGLLFRTGFEVNLDEKLLCFARATYALSLTDLQKNYQLFQSKILNNTISAEVGFLLKIGGAK